VIKRLRVLWIYITFRIKRFLFGKDYQTIRDYQAEWKRKSKGDIIRELTRISAVINKNPAIITSEFKKALRKNSKKKLIKVLVDLKLRAQFGG